RANIESLDLLHAENSFRRSAVSECGRRNDVADRVDIRFARAHERIDLHEAALDNDLRSFESAILGDGTAAGGGENDFDVERLLLSIRADDDFHATLADFGRLHFRVGQHLDALLLEDPRELFRDLFVFDWQEQRHYFDDRHLR